jgi:hypothetical protein
LEEAWLFSYGSKEKTQSLDAIMTKYAKRVSFEYPTEIFDRTLVIKVEIESLTGKKIGLLN